MKFDPYQHKEKYLSWKKSLNGTIQGISKINSKIVLEYLFDKTFKKIEEGTQSVQIRTLSQYLSSMFAPNGIDACRICSSGNLQPLIAIDHEGEVYPCDYFWGDEKTKMGNISSGSLESISLSPNNLRMREIDKTSCNPCDWKMICGGGCLAEGKDTKTGRPEYCETHKGVYNYLAKKMPELIQKDLIKPVLSWLKR